ncbi:MAG TPA: TAXI family TRAP transporter solute-binding subunit [Burkholderiales bacterium]|jgi:TRAP transporter TAXI family solute receptor|nr:TAXI family TRAP transporter solute-binding subunit [Burkholderiales bacterium]
MKVALFAAAVIAAAPALADFNDKKPINATVTGATPSGYPRTMVEGMNAVVRDSYPGSAVSFKPDSPGGGVLAIGEGRADFTATATGTEIRLANEGTPPYPKPLKGKFSFVMMLYDNQFMHFLMTKEWADANGIKSWADIAAKKPKIRLAINRPDNPQTTIGGPYEVMKAYGFTIQDIEKWGGSYVLGNSSIGLDAIVDGKADMFMNARNLGDALVKDVASKRALLWIDGDMVHIQKAADTFSFRADMVKAGTYPFMEKDYPTVRQWVSLLAGSHVPDEVVYKYVKAMAENEKRVQDIGGSLKTSFTTANMATNPAKLAYHPGALRYYKEKGLVK